MKSCLKNNEERKSSRKESLGKVRFDNQIIGEYSEAEEEAKIYEN